MSGAHLFRAGGVLLLAAVTLWLRLCGLATFARGNTLQLSDPDTLRRLVRLGHLVDANTPYPYRDPADGWYADPARRGTVLHWTLPMDAVILALDPLVAPLHPAARRFEAGAAWSGPVLGVFAAVAYYLLAEPWLGAGGAFLAALLSTLSWSWLVIGVFGSGDHASLQLLCAVPAVLGLLALLAGRGGTRLAMLTGGALGLGLWVSAETSVVFYVMAVAAAASLAVGSLEERRVLARRHLEWAAAALVVAALGDRMEHPGAGSTFEWDKISGFQLHQLLVFLLFAAVALAGLTRPGKVANRAAPPLAAGIALLAGLAPFALSPAYRAALGDQFAQARAVNLWTQSEVADYASLFSVEGFFVPNPAWERFSWLILAFPLCLLAAAFGRRETPAVRLGLALTTTGLFGLTCYEMKLGHFFMIVYAVVLVLGGGWLITCAATRLGLSPTGMCRLGGAAAVGLFLLLSHPVVGVSMARALAGDRDPVKIRRWTEAGDYNPLIRELQQLPTGEGPRQAVLTLWSLGAYILYYTRHPVVASGYHRNLAGIRDAYRVFTARLPEDLDALTMILRDRGVRWLVTANDSNLFVRGSRTFPELGDFGRLEAVTYLGDGNYSWRGAPFPEQTTRTFLWRAHLAAWLTQPVRLGDQEIRLYADVPRGSLARGTPPTYIIYEVRAVDSGSP